MKKISNIIELDSQSINTIKLIRQKALKRRKNLSKFQMEHPISFWIKKERLMNEIGKEFTIILRTKGCNWSLGESGGCTMCGYIQDATIENIDQKQIIKQFDYAVDNKIKEISDDDENYIIKIFNSGSFFDDNEISDEVRKQIYEKVANIDNIKEFVIESRLEYISSEKLQELKEILRRKHIEIAIGLETVNDYIRNYYINKGILFNDFKTVVKICKDNGIGLKTYLLLKPIFLNEQGAIDDCINSINNLINLKVNTISINPVNIQKGTLVEYLYLQNRYRPPWYYSLFKVLKKSVKKVDLNHIRILSDPTGAGTKKGIHNCLKRECETSAKNTLRNFVLTQDLTTLDQLEFECECKRQYQFEKLYH
ncbi:MAG: archaeosine biosynthesis radical SAM protein RaSEA [Candidatus Thorarchaeota archaeon]